MWPNAVLLPAPDFADAEPVVLFECAAAAGGRSGGGTVAASSARDDEDDEVNLDLRGDSSAWRLLARAFASSACTAVSRSACGCKLIIGTRAGPRDDEAVVVVLAGTTVRSPLRLEERGGGGSGGEDSKLVAAGDAAALVCEGFAWRARGDGEVLANETCWLTVQAELGPQRSHFTSMGCGERKR